MIELNLLPDVKQEFLKAERLKRVVISVCILATIGAGAVLALTTSFVYGAQAILKSQNKDAIDKEHRKLLAANDLAKTVTIKKQLDSLSSQHQSKNISSRLFDVLAVASLSGSDTIKYRTVKLNTAEGSISIEAETTGGYRAFEIFKKTLSSTMIKYKSGNDSKEESLVKSIIDKDRTISEDSEKRPILRFEIVVMYSENLFKPDSKEIKIVGPEQKNATDSAISVPKTMFGEGEKK